MNVSNTRTLGLTSKIQKLVRWLHSHVAVSLVSSTSLQPSRDQFPNVSAKSTWGENLFHLRIP